MKLAVAATAPFGADVLERLAARHEITALLTRPDAPRGRGQKTGAPPAKETAERLGRLFRRRGAGLLSAAAWGIGPRQQRRDLVTGGEALEHVRSERRRRCDGNLHG